MLPDQKSAEELMGQKPVNPIGSCFDTVAYQAVFAPDPPEDMRICHGIGVANMPGQEGAPIGHAWIEFTNCFGQKVAMDTTWGKYVFASVYREQIKISYCVEYTKHEFVQLWYEKDHSGPWDAKIKKVVYGKVQDDER
jgi:hypothetical protein